ncbi:transposase-like protein [Streptomyces sp. SAI-229]
MGSKYTKRYTEEFKRDAIALVGSSGKTVTTVARELGISSESLRGWYRKAKADRGEGQPCELTSAEREELRRLRKENREQQQTIGILKKRPPSSRRTATGERDAPVDPCGEGEPPDRPAVPGAARGPLLPLRLARGRGRRRARHSADDALAHAFTGLRVDQFGRLLRAVRERGGEGCGWGPPWRLPLAERVPLVACTTARTSRCGSSPRSSVSHRRPCAE